jgi:hypothetical protein
LGGGGSDPGGYLGVRKLGSGKEVWQLDLFRKIEEAPPVTFPAQVPRQCLYREPAIFLPARGRQQARSHHDPIEARSFFQNRERPGRLDE